MPHNAPEGIEDNRRNNVPSEMAFTKPHPDIADDALPLDGSLTMKDTEPIGQTGLHPDETRVLSGSEATQTAESAVDVSVLPPPEDMKHTVNTLTDD